MPGDLHPAEVLLHLVVQKVLVDGRELRRELLVQEFKNPIVSAHSNTLTVCNWPGAATRRTSPPPVIGQASCRAFSGHGRARSPIMFSIRSRHVPHPVQAPVASETASTVAAPLSIAVLTRSLVTARQIHANTPSPLPPTETKCG